MIAVRTQPTPSRRPTIIIVPARLKVDAQPLAIEDTQRTTFDFKVPVPVMPQKCGGAKRLPQENLQKGCRWKLAGRDYPS
jgi:hypothetical protein